MSTSGEGSRTATEAAPAELRMSQHQIAAILAGVTDGITVQDASGRLVYANDAAAHLCGFPNAAGLLSATGPEILGRFVVFHEDGRPFSLNDLPGRKLFRGEAAVETLVRFRVVATGAVHWALVNATAIRDDDGQVRLAVNIFRDITERKQAEDTARFLSAASMELTRSLDYELTLRQVAQLAVPTLADWCVVDIINDAGQLQRLATAHVDPAKAQLAMEVLERFPADRDAPAGVARVLRTGQAELAPEVTDTQLIAAARNAMHLELLRSLQIQSAIIVPLVARGQTLGAISLVQAESGRRYGPGDLAVAEELAVRAALAVDNARLYREAQQQLATHVGLNAALRETMQQLQEALTTRDEFLASVSHDLRNPLTSIKGMTQLLQRRIERTGQLDQAQVQEGLARIDAVVTRAGLLVGDLLDVARLRMGLPLELDREATDLVALTVDMVAEHQQRSDRHPIQVEARVAELVGMWDRRRLALVIGNLLDNGLKYSPDGGEIRVLMTREDGPDGWAVLTVEDHGVGIPPEDVGRIFRRFERGSNVGGQIPGTGIGLASARQIVEGHGGTITAANRSGRGAQFTVRLPLADPAAPRLEDEPGRK